MKIKKRISIVADILVDEDFDTDFLYICEDVSDQTNFDSYSLYVGRSDNFEVLDYISQETIELEECNECRKDGLPDCCTTNCEMNCDLTNKNKPVDCPYKE